jgi:hypothetical protein
MLVQEATNGVANATSGVGRTGSGDDLSARDGWQVQTLDGRRVAIWPGYDVRP